MIGARFSRVSMTCQSSAEGLVVPDPCTALLRFSSSTAAIESTCADTESSCSVDQLLRLELMTLGPGPEWRKWRSL